MTKRLTEKWIGDCSWKLWRKKKTKTMTKKSCRKLLKELELTSCKSLTETFDRANVRLLAKIFEKSTNTCFQKELSFSFVFLPRCAKDAGLRLKNLVLRLYKNAKVSMFLKMVLGWHIWIYGCYVCSFWGTKYQNTYTTKSYMDLVCHKIHHILINSSRRNSQSKAKSKVTVILTLDILCKPVYTIRKVRKNL